MKKRGLLISFEGVDGSGKSTQAKLLYEHLMSRGYKTIYVREPGGTLVSESIRSILLDKSHSQIHPRTELLLFLAARAEVVDQVIMPALTSGKIVVADRFSDSTFAYQIYGRKLPAKMVRQLNSIAAVKVKPDLTFLVDLEVASAHKRLSHEKDRMESEEQAFHNRVRQGFLKIAKAEPRRVKVMNGAMNEKEIWAKVMQISEKLISRRKIGSA